MKGDDLVSYAGENHGYRTGFETVIDQVIREDELVESPCAARLNCFATF